jgi:hypothetical protein
MENHPPDFSGNGAERLSSSRKERLKELIREYGLIAICIQVGQFILYFTVLSLAILFGWQPESASGSAGALGAALTLTLLFKPVQIAITLTTTPIVARWLRRGRNPE